MNKSCVSNFLTFMKMDILVLLPTYLILFVMGIFVTGKSLFIIFSMQFKNKLKVTAL